MHEHHHKNCKGSQSSSLQNSVQNLDSNPVGETISTIYRCYMCFFDHWTMSRTSQRFTWCCFIKLKSILYSGKFRVWVLSTQTIFLPDLVVPLLHLGLPFFLFSLHPVGLTRHLGLKPLGPNVLTLAAAEHADNQSEEDDSGYHRHGDDQGLEVHPAEAPPCVVQRTDWVWREDGPHRVCDACLLCDAPQARHISKTFFTSCSILALTGSAFRLDKNCSQTQD